MEYISARDDKNALLVIEGEYRQACGNFDTALQNVIEESQKSASLIMIPEWLPSA